MAVTQLSLSDAWAMLVGDPQAQLIDVRTMAEWNFVGVPNLEELGKSVRNVEWTRFPAGDANPDFLATASEGLDPAQPILFICRSGARSQAAATAFEQAGFTNLFNVSAGFEGDLDPQRHRRDGWKDHLPWHQG